MSQRAGSPGWVTGAVALAAAMVVTSAGAARAQSGSSTLSGFSQGFNGGLSTINFTLGDAQFTVDGVTQVGSDQSMFAKAGSTTGASDAYAGAGAIGGATAIGNNLSVNVSGQYNTVIVNSTQTNTGAVSATTTLNGKVNLDAAAQ